MGLRTSNNPNDPNDPKNQQAAGVAPTVVKSGPQTPPPVVQGQPGTSQQVRGAQAVGQKQGSGFTGAGRYLQANVGSQLGQQVAGRVQQAGQQAQQQIGQAAQTFQTGLTQAQTAYGTALGAGQAALNQLATTGGAPAQSPSDGQPVAPVAPTLPPGDVAPIDPATIAAYQTAIAGEYKGPTELENLAKLQAQAALAQQMGGATETAGGRTALLQQLFGRGSRQYTSGMSALDELVLGKSAKELAAARRGVLGVPGELESQEMLAEEKARLAGAEISGKGKTLSQEAGATEAKQKAELKGQKQTYETRLGDLYKKVQDEMKTGELSDETFEALKPLGIDENSQFYGLKPEEIATLISRKDPSEITEATSASAEQLRRINALKQLSGQKGLFSAEDIQKAGTTADPTKGLAANQKLADLQKEQKEAFEREFAGISSEGEMGEAKAYLAEQERVDRVNAEKRARVQDANRREQERRKKIQEAGAFAERKLPPEMFKPITPNPEDLKEEVNTRGGGIFTYSPGRGNRAIQSELLKQFASGGLYDKETGKLNVNLAKQLRDFWGWRPEYRGREGLFGAGKYERYAGDQARVEALNRILEKYGSGTTFKKKQNEPK